MMNLKDIYDKKVKEIESKRLDALKDYNYCNGAIDGMTLLLDAITKKIQEEENGREDPPSKDGDSSEKA